MSDDDDIVATLTKVAARQSNLINLIAAQIADMACLIEPLLPKCVWCNTQPTTVVRSKRNTPASKVCDRCAAESISSGTTTIDDWPDLDDAKLVRRLANYVEIIKEATSEINAGQVH